MLLFCFLVLMRLKTCICFREKSFVGLVDRKRTVLLNPAALTIQNRSRFIFLATAHLRNKHTVQHVKCLDSLQLVWSLHNCPYPKRDIWPSSPSSLSWFSLRNVWRYGHIVTLTTIKNKMLHRDWVLRVNIYVKWMLIYIYHRILKAESTVGDVDAASLCFVI